MSLKKITFLLISSLFLFISQACNEEPTSIGEELLQQDQINVLNLDTSIDSIPITTSYLKRTVNLGTSSRLLLGKHANIEAGILIRFNFLLTDTIASLILNNQASVNAAWIKFTKSYEYGESSGSFDFTIHKITSDWTTAGFNSDSLASLLFESVDQKIVDTSDTRMDLNPQLAFDWLKGAADTTIPEDEGIYIKSISTSNKVIGYYAIGTDDAVIPTLNVILRKQDGNLDTLIYNAFADVGVVSGEIPNLDNNYTAVQAGLEVVSRMYFDLSHIPQTAIINKATITLTYDSTKSILGSSYINSLNATFISDSTNLDSLGTSVVLNNNGNTFQGDITFITQNWVRFGNYGLLVSSSNRLLGVELFALYGASSDPALRPRLIITYTTKK